jgi:hypothetical protein
MPTTAVVPFAEALEAIGPACPSELSGCVILAAASAGPLKEVARRVTETLTGQVVSVMDITGLAAHDALPHLHSRKAVFLIASSDWPCLKLARKRAAWLRSQGLEDRCGLVLWHVEGGASAELAEDYTGLPVCALLDRDEHIERFAEWIAAEHRRAAVRQLGALDEQAARLA